MNIKRSILIRVRIAFLFVMLFGIAVIVKISHIQFVEGEEWTKLSEQITFDYKKIKATRGNIYSDNGSLLATDLPFYKVAFDPRLAKDKIFKSGIDSLSMLLARYYKDKSATEYKRMIQDARAANRQYIVLNRKQINYQTKKIMSEWPIFRNGRYGGGVIFEKIDVRYRPFSNLSRRTVGFVNENGKGAGLEYSFNEALGGQDGEALFQKIAGSTWKPVYDVNNIKSKDGLDIQTTIDINLQDVAETSLHRAMEHHEADAGTVVVMEVSTGHIKAISNLTRQGNSYNEIFNHAVGGLFEPGSTFKLVTMMALLEESNIKLTDSIDTGNGELTFYKNTVKDHHDGGYGKLTIRDAFVLSSNVAMAKLLDNNFGLKPDKFVDLVDELKLSKPLGLQIKGEGYPKIFRPGSKGWSGITLPWMAYGYGFEVTPLHTLTLYNAIANNGKMIKPIFVTAISKADQVKKEFETETLNSRICSSSTLNKLRMLLEGVVEEGTASNLKNAHYKIAGKTGTAQILENGRYTKKYITSFVGYFPAHDPKYTAIVLIKNPKGWRQYGNNVAGPVFKEIADNIYSRDINLHMAMEKKKVLEYGVFPVIQAGKQDELTMLCNELGVSNHTKTDEDWIRAVRNGNSVLWDKNTPAKDQVPNVKGMTFRDAIFLLEQSGLHVEYNGKGRVVNQSLTPGSKVSKGKTIHISLS
ncbi:MAG TPA: penicillin-binding transpeptidase domain-containing protein [Cyclobacteriaceae bacterium]|nr:transpeptidase family protein [Cyclobacteriaceae bacterium]HRK55071.1 penicillin-binding transpeptidase domain-containing protein [Cyclobacteriaceae bacterium]